MALWIVHKEFTHWKVPNGTNYTICSNKQVALLMQPSTSMSFNAFAILLRFSPGGEILFSVSKSGLVTPQRKQAKKWRIEDSLRHFEWLYNSIGEHCGYFKPHFKRIMAI